MKYAISALLGMILGGAAGYFVAKKRFDKELEKRVAAIKETHEALREKKESEEQAAAEKEQELQKAEAEETAGVDINKLADEESDDEDYNYFDSDEVVAAQREFEKEVHEYLRTGEAYNITKAEYDEPYPGFGKSVLMINENEDRAYDANTGEEVEDWRVCIAEEDGTLDESNADPETGRIYIRSERMAMDYEIAYSVHGWVD